MAVLLNTGNGTFGPATTYNSGGNVPGSAATGDFNGDGKPDIVVANQCASLLDCSHGVLGVILGNGDGTFQPAVSYPIGGNSPAGLTVRDFDGDGKLDVAVVSQPNCCLDGSIGSVNILLGNGDGSFRMSVAYPTGDPDSTAVVAGDFNGDGKLDLAVANGNCALPSPEDVPVCGTGSVGILLGNGDGSFQAAVRFSTVDAFAFTLTTGDFNGDGRLDLAVGNTNCEDLRGSCGVSSSIAILQGKGDGTFAPLSPTLRATASGRLPRRLVLIPTPSQSLTWMATAKSISCYPIEASCWVTATELSRRHRATTPPSLMVFLRWWPTSTRTGNPTWP